MPNCPKEVIVATFLYLERLANLEGNEKKINLKDGDAEDIASKILSIYKRHNADLEKVENSSDNLPHKTNTFVMSSKSNLSSVNYIEYNKNFQNILSDKTYKLELSTDYDVELGFDFLTTGLDNLVTFDQITQTESKKIVLPDEDEKAYSLSGINRTVSQIFNFLSEKMDFGMDSKMIAENFTSVFSSFKKTDLIRSKDKYAEILEFDFEPSFMDEFEKNILENKTSDGDIDVDSLIKEVRTFLNSKTKENLYTLIRKRTEGLKPFSTHLNNLLSFEENKDLINSTLKAETCNIELSFTSTETVSPLYYNSYRSNTFPVYAKISAKRKFLDDDLIREIKEDVTPEKTIYDLSDTKIKINFDFDGNDEVSLIRVASQQASKDYFYHSDFITKKKDFVLSVDESDAGAKGAKANIMRELAKNSTNIVLATGTFLDGYPKNIAYQMAYLDGIEDVKEFSTQLTENYGVFSLKNNSIKNLVSAIMRDSSIDSAFYDAILKYNVTKDNKHDIISNFTNNFISIIKEKGLIDGEIEFMQALSSFSYIFNKAKNIKDFPNSLMFVKDLIFRNRNGSNPLVKEEAGLQSVFSFIQLLNSQDGGHINIATREMLHGVKEQINYPDKAPHYETKDAIISNRLTYDDIKDTNAISPLLVDAYFEYYGRENQVSTLKYLLQTNFEYFIDSTTGKDAQSKANLDIVMPTSMTRDEYLSLVSETNMSTKNGIIEQYKLYLTNNGVIPQLEDKKKQNLLEHLIVKYQEHFFDAHLNNKPTDFIMKGFILPEKISNSSGEMILGSDVDFHNAYPINNNTGEPILFSYDIAFSKKIWDEFLPEPISYKYKIASQNNTEIMNVFTSRGRENNIFNDINNGLSPVVGSARTLSTAINVCDAIAGAINRNDLDTPVQIQVVQSAELKDILKKIDSQKLLEKYKIELLILPSNLISSEVNKAEARKIQSPFFTNIDASARGLDLSSKGEPYKDENGKEKRYGRIYTTGTTVSPANLQQFFSRTFKPKVSERADISVYCGGENVSFNAVSKEENRAVVDYMKQVEEVLKTRVNENGDVIVTDIDSTLEEIAKECISNNAILFKPTFNDILGERALEALKVSKEFMSGERSDRAVSDIKNIVEISEAYQMDLKRRNEQAVSNNNEVSV